MRLRDAVVRGLFAGLIAALPVTLAGWASAQEPPAHNPAVLELLKQIEALHRPPLDLYLTRP